MTCRTLLAPTRSQATTNHLTHARSNVFAWRVSSSRAKVATDRTTHCSLPVDQASKIKHSSDFLRDRILGSKYREAGGHLAPRFTGTEMVVGIFFFFCTRKGANGAKYIQLKYSVQHGLQFPAYECFLRLELQGNWYDHELNKNN